MKRIPVLDLHPQLAALKSEFLAALEEVLDSTAFIQGPAVQAFEKEAASYLGVRHAIGCNSGTDALVLGLRALGVGPGDEVVTTPFSFFATAESISAVGARPVFVDIEEDGFNLDPSGIEAALTPRTRAIVPVHLFGRPADMERILAIAEGHGLPVLEDSAQAFGSQLPDGRRTGAVGDLGAFSFFPSKNLGAFGDGGLVSTNDDHLAETVRKLAAHGSLERYRNESIGYNSRLDSVQAAILRVKLPHLDDWNAARRLAARRYQELLAEIPGVEPPAIVPGHVFHQYTVRIRGADRDRVHATMNDAGIGCMVYYPVPQDELPVYAGQYPRHPRSHAAAQQVLSLPIWPEIEEGTQARVVEALREALSSPIG